MRVLGLHLLKGQFRFSVLEGSKSHPSLVNKGKSVTIDSDDIPALMDWYDSQFRQLITTYQPDRIAYRLTLNPNKEQLVTLEFPLGVLNLVAHEKSLPTCLYTAQSFVSSKLGLAKGVDLYEHCDVTFGKNPPYWDDSQKHAILAAWFEL